MKKIITNFLATALLSGAFVVSGSAFAATQTTPMTVSGTVSPACSLLTSSLDFGVYDPSGALQTANANVYVKCTRGTPFTLLMSAGTGASVANRSMGGTAGNTGRLTYNLYTGSDYAIVADDTGVGRRSATGIGSNQNLVYYGRLPAGQYLKADSYSDTITMTVSY